MSLLQDTPARSPAWSIANITALLGAVLGVLLVRGIVVSLYGTDAPYWDQWDGEILTLYKPFVEGNLRFLDLFNPHNEHRIFFTRVFGLLLFGANEAQFDNMVESLANVVLYTAMLCVFRAPFFRELKNGSLLSAGLALIVFGALPYAWENIATGFQNAFYFMSVWMLAAVGALAFGRRGHWTTVAAIAVALIFGLFTLASGCLAAPVIALLAFCLYRTGELSWRQFVVVAAVSIAIFALGLWLIPPTEHHIVLRSAGIGEFVFVALTALCWPLPASWIVLPMIWWPSIIWLLRCVLRKQTPISRVDVFYLGVAAWAALQALAIATSRGHEVTFIAGRYVDSLALGYAANLLLAIRFVGALPASTRRMALKPVLSALVVVVVAGFFAGLGVWSMRGASSLASRASFQTNAQRNIANFLNGVDPTALQNKHPYDISYPSEPRLATILADPVVRNMLPASVNAAVRVEWQNCLMLSSPGAYFTTPANPTTAYGTYSPTIGNSNVGRCTSQPLRATRSHVRIMTAGYLNKPNLGLEFRSHLGDASFVLKRVVPDGEAWHWEGIALPSATYVLVATDSNPDFWFAFTAPVELGRLSAWATDIVDFVHRITQAP